MTVVINGSSGISGVAGTSGSPALRGDDTDTGISFGTDVVIVSTAGTERARIDSSGRLLVGTTSASTVGSVVVQGNSSGSTNAGYLNLQRGQSAGASINSGTMLGVLQFGDSSGSVFAQVYAEGDGASGSNDYPSRLVFSTTADGASSPTERMRITSGGRLFVNTQTSLANAYLAHFSSSYGGGIWSEATAAGDACYVARSPGDTVGMHYAGLNNAGTIVYRVNQNGNVQNTNNSYGAISDIKLKENIVDASSQWDDLKALQVRNYNFKEGQTHTQIGLVAQEVELISPGLVSESPDRDAEGNDLGTVTKSVNYSVLYMKAVKALQEAMERIEQLETKVAALEAQP